MISRFRAVRHSKANQRVLFPASGYITGDLALFYGKMAAVLLPHLSHRPVTLKRLSDDIHRESFWEKDLPAFPPKWIKTFAVPRVNEPSDIHYINIDDAKTLVWAAQMGCVEIHPFLTAIQKFTSRLASCLILIPALPQASLIVVESLSCCGTSLLDM